MSLTCQEGEESNDRYPHCRRMPRRKNTKLSAEDAGRRISAK